MDSLLKRPSAWLPVVMSLVALAFVIGYMAIVGVAEQPKEDEGAAARLFQLLLAGQLPIMAFFIIKWLPQKPRQTLQVVLLQITAASIAIATVFLLEM